MNEPKVLRIAVIDDHPAFRKGLIALLSTWSVKHVVLEAKNGVDYEQRCAEFGHVHVAVVDLQMPKRDGYDTLLWMKRNQPRTLGVAITFDPTEAAVRKALSCRAVTVLSKTVEAEELHRALNEVLRTGHHVNELVDRDMHRKATLAHEATHPAARWTGLSPREKEVMLLYTREGVPGLAEVAVRLGIAYGTAEKHLTNAYAKLGIHSKEEAVRLVLTHKLS